MQRTLMWFLALFAVVAGVIQLAPVQAQQSDFANLAITPADRTVGPGQRVSYDLTISGAKRLFGADIELTFDPAAALVIDSDPAQEGVQVHIGTLLDPGFVVYNVADNAAGKIRVTFSQVAPTPPASGDGSLLSFEMEGKPGGGNPKLKVSAALLARDDGLPQPVRLPASAGTPVPPSVSPVANPTEIPPSPTPAPRESAQATGSIPGTPVTQGATSGLGAQESVDHSRSGSSKGSAIALALAGIAILGVGLAFGRHYIKRNGETK